MITLFVSSLYTMLALIVSFCMQYLFICAALLYMECSYLYITSLIIILVILVFSANFKCKVFVSCIYFNACIHGVRR